MNFKQAFIMAIKSLTASKMRSFLTMLGIIIGVASVIILISLVDGMSNNIVKQFESMGTNLISVSIQGRGGNRAVTPEQIDALVEKNADVIGAVTPNVTAGTMTAKYKTKNADTNIVGVNENFKEIRNAKVSSGRFLEFIDVERRQKVCVIGSYIAKELFDGVNPIGQDIKIQGDTFSVIGVLEAKQSSVQGSDDDKIIVPYSVATRLSRFGRVSNYSFSAVSKETVTKAMEVISAFLISVFSSEDAYRVYNQADSLKQLNEMTGTITMVLVGIAAISLLVGGIGIMNIMLVSVTERTREIGIRKSLGAKRKDIMSQFVVEAATTSSIGGIIGIIIGIGASYIAGSVMKLSVTPSLMSVMIAFSVSVVIGMTFGYFPASKAAKLNPIDALKYE